MAKERVSDGIITNVDFAQTILDAAGVPYHPRMQGASLFPELIGEEGPQRDGMYYRCWEHDDIFHNVPARYGFRTDKYKLIYFYNDGMGIPGCGAFTYTPEWELYDLVDDPAEIHNGYEDSRYVDVREDLKRRMWRAQQAVGDEPHPSQPASAPGRVMTSGRPLRAPVVTREDPARCSERSRS